MPLGQPIPPPVPRTAGDVAIRPIRLSDAAELGRQLRVNRAWLERWEATHPSGNSAIPGTGPMRPLIKALRRQLRAGSGVAFVILYRGNLIGQLSVSEISGGALQSAQIGYWVSQHVAGRGITPAAVALAVDYVFSELGLHRIEICVRPENTASLRVVEKLGLDYEGRRNEYIHIDGAWRDHLCYVVVRDRIPGEMQRILADRILG